MNEQEALRKEMLDRRIELIFEEMERNHPEFSQEEAELSRICLLYTSDAADEL